jgi:hypothetical protein
MQQALRFPTLPTLSAANNALSIVGSKAVQGLLPQSALAGQSLMPIASSASRALMVIPDAANGNVAGSQQLAVIMDALPEQRALLLNEAKVWSELPEAPQQSASAKGTSALEIPKNLYKIHTAEERNEWWRVNRRYDNPPYKPGTPVYESIYDGSHKYVRVFDGVNSRYTGQWIIREDYITGLTPREIQDLYALPQIPTMVCDIDIPIGTHIEISIANAVPKWNANGEGIQADLMGVEIPDEMYTNPRPLPYGEG